MKTNFPKLKNKQNKKKKTLKVDFCLLLLEKSLCGAHRGGLWFKLAKWTEISKKQQESTTDKQISTKIST